MRAKKSPYSSPLAGKLLEEATESHVSPYLNNAHTDHRGGTISLLCIDHKCFSFNIFVVLELQIL